MENYKSLPSDILLEMLCEAYRVIKKCDEIKHKIEKKRPFTFLKSKEYQRVASRKLELDHEYSLIREELLLRIGEEDEKESD